MGAGTAFLKELPVYLLSALVAAALSIYLLVALLKPEYF
ncbi:MAG: K(+)-transporting ATPase subunit F [Planctomycetota bacterium]|nr:K(+)-transporting ATPase subunit F [Planctomycetota bacterium]